LPLADVYAASWRCFVYLLTRIGAPATLDRTGWAAKLCSDVRLQRCYGRAKLKSKRKYGTAELQRWGPPVPRPPSRTRCGAHAHDEGGG
jgi:hypothetical protein